MDSVAVAVRRLDYIRSDAELRPVAVPNQAYGKLARRVGRVGSGPSFLPWLRVCPIRARVPAVLLPAARRARRPAVCLLARHKLCRAFSAVVLCAFLCACFARSH
jgi:hypothetical protein